MWINYCSHCCSVPFLPLHLFISLLHWAKTQRLGRPPGECQGWSQLCPQTWHCLKTMLLLLLENMFNHLSATDSLPVFILPENTFTCIILGYVVHISSQALWQKNVSTILILGFSHSLVQFMWLKGSWFGLKYSISSLFRHPQYPHFSMFTVIILIELDPMFLSVLCSPWQDHQYLSYKQACWNPKIF